MQRRFVLCTLASLPLAARAHHGWSSFDTARPIYLEGRAVRVGWRNPHAEIDLELAPDLKLPADLPQRKTPAQAAPVDGPALLKAAQLPARRDKRWHLELAPLTRMQAWKVAEIKAGDALSVLGYTQAGDKGEALLRVEYLWVAGNAYAMRSSPA